MVRAGIVSGLIGVVVAFSVGCAAPTVEDEVTASAASATKIDCSFVKCAMPVCADGQRLAQNQGTCCPTCVGKPSRCAAVLCAAVVCPEGEQLVFSNGDCCGRCAAKPAAKECRTSDDCPQLQCFACPCPVSECRGGQCVTSTPDASTCGATL